MKMLKDWIIKEGGKKRAKIGYLPDGSIVVERDVSSQGLPVRDIFEKNGERKKILYDGRTTENHS